MFKVAGSIEKEEDTSCRVEGVGRERRCGEEREEREATQSSPTAHLEEGMRLKSLTPLLAQLRKSHDPNTHL